MTDKAKGTSVPKLIVNAAIAAGDSIYEDLGEIIKDWNGNPETPPDFMIGMPGPEPA